MIMEREADKRITFHGNALDEDSIIQWWKQISKTVSYGLVTCNCSTIVFKALSAGGATCYVRDPNYKIWTPDRLYEFCERLQWKTYNILNGRYENVETDFEYILNGLKKVAKEEKDRKQEIERQKKEWRKRQAQEKKRGNDSHSTEDTKEDEDGAEKETDTNSVQDRRNDDIGADWEIVSATDTYEHGKKKRKKRNRKRR